MTAVEWLESRLIQDNIFSKEEYELFEQAKEMEKQKIIDFADSYGTYLLAGGTMSAATYNETFKSE